MNKKSLFIVLGIVIIVTIIAVTLQVMNNLKYSYKLQEVSESEYYILVHEGKNGVIDKKGNIIIDAIYDIVQIPNPSKPVFICIGEYDEKTEEYKSKALNEKNEELFTDFENLKAIPIETNISNTPYEKDTLCYKKNGKYGLINSLGKKITDAIYDEIKSVNYKEGTFLVKQNEKYGVINKKGTIIIEPKYETITSDNYFSEKNNNKNSGFIVSEKTEEGYRYGYINYRGKIVLPIEYTELERITEIKDEKNVYFIAFKNGQAGILKNKKAIVDFQYEDIQYNSLNDIFILQRNSKQGIVSKEGRTIINTEYDKILFGGMYVNAIKDENLYLFDFNGNSVEKNNYISKMKTENSKYYITIDKNDIYRVVDEENNNIIDNNYTYIEYLPGDYFIVAKDGKNGVVDINGKSLIDLNYTSIFRLNDDSNILQAEIIGIDDNNSSLIELYSMDMHKISKMENASVNIFENYIVLSSNNDYQYFDMQGNRLDSKDLFKNNKLYSKKINGMWGFVDNEGNLVLKNEYELVTDFNKEGFAGIKKDGKWGVINKEGEIIQEPIYILEDNQPNFIGKYYRIRNWDGNDRYSDNIK